MREARGLDRVVRRALTAACFGIAAVALFAGPARGAESFTAPVNLPDCNSGDSDVKVIESDADWGAINDSQYRVFCVKPGNYRSAGVIDLQESGTDQDRRYIRYWDPQAPNRTTHPVQMSSSDRAVVRGIHFDGADYWTIWGLTSRGGSGQLNPSNGNIRVQNNSNHNVFDRMLVEYGRGTLVGFGTDSDDNVFQNGVIRDANVVPNDDNMCMNFSGEDTQRNRVVRSELYDCTDSIHVSPAGAGNNRGTVIAYNDLYITPDLYTDCNGNRDPNGNCSCAENAIDVKAIQGQDSSSEPEKNWLKIVGNRMWGFRRTDTACGGTGSSGAIVTVHFDRADFILAKRNIIFDGPVGWMFSAPGGDHISLLGNIFWDISRKGLIMHRESANVEAYYNTIVDIGNYHSILGGAPASNVYKCNTAVNGPDSTSSSAAKVDYNAYFNADRVGSGSNDLEFSSASDANAEDFCFDRKIWTGPDEVCVPHALKTSNSPHQNHCDPNIGSVSDSGVNDTTDASFFEPDWRSYGSFSVEAEATPSGGVAPLEVELEATPSGGSKPYSYEWTFEDGSTASGATVTHTYDQTGTYEPTVEVTDDGGQTAEDSVTVEVLSEDALVFSPIPHYGNAANYEPREPSRWTVEKQDGDKRYFLQTTDYEGAGDGQPGEVSLVRNRRFEDFELSFSVRTNEDISENTGADFVVAFGWQDPDNYHFILGHVQAKFTKLFTVEDGERELVAELGSALIPDEDWHDVEVRRSGSEVTVALDGERVHTATLSTNFTGRLGVGSFDESVWYDDIDVEPRGGLSGGSDDVGTEGDAVDGVFDDTGSAGDAGAGGTGGTDAAAGHDSGGGSSGCSCTAGGSGLPVGFGLFVVVVVAGRAVARRR